MNKIEEVCIDIFNERGYSEIEKLEDNLLTKSAPLEFFMG